MDITKLKRDNEFILISDYGFEWYINGQLIRNGLVENKEEDIELLKGDGFEEIEIPQALIWKVRGAGISDWWLKTEEELLIELDKIK